MVRTPNASSSGEQTRLTSRCHEPEEPRSTPTSTSFIAYSELSKNWYLEVPSATPRIVLRKTMKSSVKASRGSEKKTATCEAARESSEPRACRFAADSA
eukprot:5242028-Pleurochrysis_carterae.AAC.1